MSAVSVSRSREEMSVSTVPSSSRSDESAPEWTDESQKKLLLKTNELFQRMMKKAGNRSCSPENQPLSVSFTSNKSENLEKTIVQSDNSVKPEQSRKLESHSGWDVYE